MKEISFDFDKYVEQNQTNLKYRLKNDIIISEKRRVRRQKAKKIITKITSIAREVLDIYGAVKRKDPVSVALGAISAYGCVSELFEKPAPQAQEYLRSIGASKIFPMLCSFIFHTLQQMDVPSKRIWTHTSSVEDGEEREGIEEFDLGEGVKVWFIDSGSDDRMENPANGPFIINQDDFSKRFSIVIEQKLGKIMAINTLVRGWDEWYYLGSLKIPTTSYVSHINEDDLMNRVFALQKLGFNRSVLFFGPPGIGKTTLAAKLSERMDGRLLVASSVVLESGRGRDMLEALSNLIDPAVVLLDDLDKMWRPNEMLDSMERLNRQVGTRKRLIIGTVNTLSDIPEPLRRPGRFDEIVEFPQLTYEQRREILRVYTKEFGSSLTNVQIDKLAKASSDMTGAYLKEIAKRTTVVPFDKMCDHITQMKKICNMISDDDEEEEEKSTKRTRSHRQTRRKPKF